MPRSGKWVSREFMALTAIIVAAFSNICIFYSFYHYLGAIGIPTAWRGFLVGLEPMAAFILRLFILPWLHARNALKFMTASLLLLVIVSWSYLWALSIPTLIIVRVLHGTAFVLLTAATMALVVNFIPKTHSGQGFGILTVATMLPYAVIPPLSELLLPILRNEADLYAGVSIFAILAIVLLSASHRPISSALPEKEGVLLRRPTLVEIRENLKLPSVTLLLAALLLAYFAHATVFYFMKDLALHTGGGDVGLFFGLSMVTMIAVRTFGGRFFDRSDKVFVLQGGLWLLIPCLIALPLARSGIIFYALAGLYGVCMGVVMPLFNALIFTASPPLLRGLNTNLGLFTLDMAYFLTPYLSGFLITAGTDFDYLFYLSSVVILLSLSLTLILRRHWQPL